MMDTIVACLTPPGKAAIATLAARGPLAWTITRQLFRPRKGSLPDEPECGRYWHGKFGADVLDEVIVAAKSADSVELHCHGGVEVVRMMEGLFAERGAVVVPWQQFCDGPTGLYEQLTSAPTARTAAILLDQIDGAWDRAVERVARGEHQVAVRLSELVPLGQHLVAPWRIAIGGAPNVGKSSLVNALAGFTRSVVAPTPGTTRDAVAVRLAIDGWPVEIIDTAGIRAAAGDLEGQGIERAKAAAADADLRLWILDGAAEAIMPDDADRWMLVINKIDLPAAWDWDTLARALHVSAKTRAGVEDLCAAVSRALVPSPPEAGEAVPCLAEQVAWVRAACV